MRNSTCISTWISCTWLLLFSTSIIIYLVILGFRINHTCSLDPIIIKCFGTEGDKCCPSISCHECGNNTSQYQPNHTKSVFMIVVNTMPITAEI